MKRKHFIPFLLGLGIICPAEAQVAIQNARLELVELKRHFREETSIQAARGSEYGVLDFEVEFEDDADVDRVHLQTPDDLYENLERDGRIYRVAEYVGALSTRFRGTYTISVELRTGGTVDFEFVVDNFVGLTDFPEIEFPTDGADELDAEDLRADWRSSGDSNRVDLFEIDNPTSNNPPALDDSSHTIWRTSSEDQDLESDLFPNRRYELWMGETGIDDSLSADFPVEFWYTSSLYVRFTTGPDPREDITGFNFNEYVTSATAGFERKRFGQSSPASVDRVVARLVGNAIEEAEVSRIQGPMDARLVGSLAPLNVVAADTIFEKEIGSSAGESVLFLMEFRITALVGSEIARVDSPLAFPSIVSPLSNESGLGSSIQVDWTQVPGAESHRASINQVGGGLSASSGFLGMGISTFTFEGVPANLDLVLEVEAKSVEGSVSSTCILVSTRPKGDANGDGATTGTDLFGYAGNWMRGVPVEAEFTTRTGGYLLDLDGSETVGPVDLLLFLESL